MKSLLLFISAILGVPIAPVQFNTLRPHSDIRRICSDSVLTQNDPPETGKVVAIDTGQSLEAPKVSEDTIGKATSSSDTISHKRWVEQYLSVALPLDHIEVTSAYGTRKEPFSGKVSWHSGLNLRARYEKVYNMMYGVVLKVASNHRAGKYITIQYGDFTVSYCHLSSQLVSKGSTVHPGEVIGISGNTGHSTGPHLHLTLKYHGKHCNPKILLEYILNVRKESFRQLLHDND